MRVQGLIGLGQGFDWTNSNMFVVRKVLHKINAMSSEAIDTQLCLCVIDAFFIARVQSVDEGLCLRLCEPAGVL